MPVNLSDSYQNNDLVLYKQTLEVKIASSPAVRRVVSQLVNFIYYECLPIRSMNPFRPKSTHTHLIIKPFVANLDFVSQLTSFARLFRLQMGRKHVLGFKNCDSISL